MLKERCFQLVVTTVFLLMHFQLNAQITDTIHHRPKLGLVLSGGGAKGLAHIGVLKVLEEYGLRPDYISGTSMGALVGALYSLGYSAEQLEEFVVNADWDDILSDRIPFNKISIFDKDNYPGYPLQLKFNDQLTPSLPSGAIQGQKIQALFSKLAWSSNSYPNFDSFPIPFRCLATDLISGNPILFKDGDLSEAMRSSMSIPTIFSPIEKGKMLLVDGGVTINFPVQECINMGADILIGVYTGLNANPEKKDLQSMIEILKRSSTLHGTMLAKTEAKKTDLFIMPEFGKIGPEDFGKNKKIIDLGEKTARDSSVINKIIEIKKLINTAKINISHNVDEKLWVDNITVEGGSNKTKIIAISQLKPKSYISNKDLDEAINRIYSTWQYEKVSYHFNKNLNERTLVLNIKKNSRSILEVGLHYDNTYDANALIKFKYKNLFFKATKANIKLSLSKNPRSLFSYKYYPTKNQKIEFSLNNYLHLNRIPEIIKEEDEQFRLGYYVNTYANFNIKTSWTPIKNLMIQASLGKQYSNISLKEGLEIYYNTNSVNTNNYFYSLSFLYNTQNDAFFPTKGTFFDIAYKYSFLIKSNNKSNSELVQNLSDEISEVTLNFKKYFNILDNVSIIPEINFGTMSDRAFIANRFFIGGFNYSLRQNVVNFGGVKANYIATDFYLIGGLNLQYSLNNKWFFNIGSQSSWFVDYANYIISENESVLVDNILSNWNCRIGYKSPIGPLYTILSKSPERKDFTFSVNIGIPF